MPDGIEEWARNLIERIKRKEEEQKQADAMELQRGQQISAHAPRVWRLLNEDIQSKVKVLNGFFGKGDKHYLEFNRQGDKVSVTSLKGKLELEFERTQPSVETSIVKHTGYTTEPPTASRRFLFTVDNGEVCLREEKSVDPVEIGEVTKSLLESLLS